MLLLSVFSVLLITVSSSPLLQSEDDTRDYAVAAADAAAERNFALSGDTVVSDNGREYFDEDVDESRLLTSGTAGLIADPKGITYKAAGIDTTQPYNHCPLSLYIERSQKSLGIIPDYKVAPG